MIRLVVIALLVVLGTVALYRLYRSVRAQEWDWTGIGVAIAFVLLAIYLRNITGIGGGFE